MTTAFLLQDGVVQQIDNRVSVKFPVKATVEMEEGTPNYKAKPGDKSLMCLATYEDFAGKVKDSASMAASLKLPASLDATAQGLTEANPGSSIVSKQSVSFKGHPCYEITLDTHHKAGDQYYQKMEFRFIQVGLRLYQLVFYYMDKNPHSEERNKFFDSFSAS